MKKSHFLLGTLLLISPCIGISGCSNNNQGSKYIENFKEDWEYRNQADQRMLELGVVLLEYMGRNGEKLPPTHNSNAFVNALKPHLGEYSEKVFYHPQTGNLVEVNPAISGISLTDLEKSGKTVLVGITRGTDKVESGVLRFNPKDSIYIDASYTFTSSVDSLLQSGE